MAYVYNDGGRADAGYKGSAGDCGARAMAIALDLYYQAAYDELAQANKEAGRPRSARNGIMKDVYSKVLERHGWVWHPAPKFVGRKAYASDMPEGTVIARMAGHFVCIIDGVVQDTFDCSHKMVYGFWAKPSDKTQINFDAWADLLALAPGISLDTTDTDNGVIYSVKFMGKAIFVDASLLALNCWIEYHAGFGINLLAQKIKECQAATLRWLDQPSNAEYWSVMTVFYVGMHNRKVKQVKGAVA